MDPSTVKLYYWFLGLLATAAFGMTVALATKASIWMNEVKDNHLTHIQKATEQSSATLTDVKESLLIHINSETNRHAEVLRAIDRSK